MEFLNKNNKNEDLSQSTQNKFQMIFLEDADYNLLDKNFKKILRI